MIILKAAYIQSVPCWNYRNASTPTWRLYWNPESGAWLSAAGKVMELTPETVTLIAPGTPFSTGCRKPFPHFYIHFSLPGVKPAYRGIWQFRAAEVAGERIWEKLPGADGTAMELAAGVLAGSALLQLPEGTLLPDDEAGGETVFDRAVAAAENSPHCIRNCAELALACGGTPESLRRQFLKAVGIPVKQWLNARRMEKAAQLLMYQGRSIKETADILGFSDRFHFSKAFRKYFGMSPGRFISTGGIPLP